MHHFAGLSQMQIPFRNRCETETMPYQFSWKKIYISISNGNVQDSFCVIKCSVNAVLDFFSARFPCWTDNNGISSIFELLRLFVSGQMQNNGYYVENWLKVRVKILQFWNKQTPSQPKQRRKNTETANGFVECSRMAQIIKDKTN